MRSATVTMALLFSMAGPNPEEHHHGKHGNPGDLQSYIAKMESPDRDAWQKPAEVVRALQMQPGQVACDIGAGPGYFPLRLAREAGGRGAGGPPALRTRPRPRPPKRNPKKRGRTPRPVPCSTGERR